MIDYGKEPSNQMEMEGLGQDGQSLMEAAREWADAHEDEFDWYMGHALDSCRGGAKASPNFELQCMRHRFKVSVPNAYSPCLARIAMERDRGIAFRLAKSKVDGFTEAIL